MPRRLGVGLACLLTLAGCKSGDGSAILAPDKPVLTRLAQLGEDGAVLVSVQTGQWAMAKDVLRAALGAQADSAGAPDLVRATMAAPELRALLTPLVGPDVASAIAAQQSHVACALGEVTGTPMDRSVRTFASALAGKAISSALGEARGRCIASGLSLEHAAPLLGALGLQPVVGSSGGGQVFRSEDGAFVVIAMAIEDGLLLAGSLSGGGRARDAAEVKAAANQLAQPVAAAPITPGLASLAAPGAAAGLLIRGESAADLGQWLGLSDLAEALDDELVPPHARLQVAARGVQIASGIEGVVGGAPYEAVDIGLTLSATRSDVAVTVVQSLTAYGKVVLEAGSTTAPAPPATTVPAHAIGSAGYRFDVVAARAAVVDALGEERGRLSFEALLSSGLWGYVRLVFSPWTVLSARGSALPIAGAGFWSATEPMPAFGAVSRSADYIPPLPSSGRLQRTPYGDATLVRSGTGVLETPADWAAADVARWSVDVGAQQKAGLTRLFGLPVAGQLDGIVRRSGHGLVARWVFRPQGGEPARLTTPDLSRLTWTPKAPPVEDACRAGAYAAFLDGVGMLAADHVGGSRVSGIVGRVEEAARCLRDLNGGAAEADRLTWVAKLAVAHLAEQDWDTVSATAALKGACAQQAVPEACARLKRLEAVPTVKRVARDSGCDATPPSSPRITATTAEGRLRIFVDGERAAGPAAAVEPFMAYESYARRALLDVSAEVSVRALKPLLDALAEAEVVMLAVLTADGKTTVSRLRWDDEDADESVAITPDQTWADAIHIIGGSCAGRALSYQDMDAVPEPGTGLGIGPRGLDAQPPTATGTWLKVDVDTQVSGACHAGSVRTYMRRQAAGLHACLHVAEVDKGAVTVTFTIEADGRVSGAKAAQNTTGAEGVSGCVSRRAARLRFPMPKEGTCAATVTVTAAPAP